MSRLGLAMAAEELAGSRFRLHGRDPASGLDCIGVLAASLAAIGRGAALPTGYPLRLRDLARWIPEPASSGFEPADPCEPRPGDVLLFDCGAGQYHLAISISGDRYVHAHAGLRCVVVSAGPPAGEPIGCWRLTNQET